MTPFFFILLLIFWSQPIYYLDMDCTAFGPPTEYCSENKYIEGELRIVDKIPRDNGKVLKGSHDALGLVNSKGVMHIVDGTWGDLDGRGCTVLEHEINHFVFQDYDHILMDHYCMRGRF